MELDDQLAALAAGELDDADARALEARASSEPALGARLARFRRLEELLRDGSGPVAMDPEAVRRLDATFDEALGALSDGPLLGAPAAAAAAAGDADVVDLAARRERRRPRWIAGAAAAAAVLAGVVVVGPNLVGGSDDSGEDTMAMDSAEDEAATEEQQLDEDAAGSAEAAPDADALSDDGDGADDSAAGEATEEATEEDAPEQDASDDATGLELPVVPHDDTAAALLDRAEVDTALQGVADPEGRRARQEAVVARGEDDPLVRCTGVALDLEPGALAVLLAVGALDGVEVVHVVLATEAGGALAVTLDAADCTVLDRTER